MAPEVERKLAAIMFTDIVGSTALMAESEPMALRVKQRHRTLVRTQVDRYHGEFIEAPGDETLSIFGSALDAVSCALAIEAETQGDAELRLHIGVHTADVLRQGGEVHGDGVNVASRVCRVSERGGVCVSGEVHKSIRNQPGIVAIALGERELKNVPEPVAVYAVTGTAAEPRSTSRGAPKARWTVAALATFAAIGLVVGGWLYRPTSSTGAIRSLAVLPLENLSGDREQEYFADGMTEALIAELGKVGVLHVTSRTSVMRYKRTEKSVPEIARELGVDALVEGSILRVGNRVRITAQLIHAAADRHLWAESYEREIRDVLALQGEVARAIAQQVEVKLRPGQDLSASSTRTVDPAAYEAYLKGRFFLSQESPEAYRRAIEQFERAIEGDADYALAHSGLAEAYVRLPDYMAMRPREAKPLAQAAASRALALDDGLAEVHTSHGAVLFWLGWDWAGAERAFKRALELNPSDVRAHLWYGDLLRTTGRPEEALAEQERALELDPLSLWAHVAVAKSHLSARQYDRATEELQAALELDREYVQTNLWLGLTYSHQSLHQQATELIERTVGLAGQDRALWPELATVYARAGRTEEARALVERSLELSRSRYMILTLVAETLVALGEWDQAFDLLERAFREGDHLLRELPWRQTFDPLRADPRFADLLRRMGLAESPALSR